MNNLAISLKKFFTNKNTVTIIGVVAILIILYVMYTKQINKATEKIQVPVASKTINPQTQITADDITHIEVANAAKPDKVIMKDELIIGKYTGVGVTVPEGSMFYNDVIVEKEELPGNWLTLLEKDAEGNLQIPYYFSVNTTTTFGNSIQPGDYVDFYVRAYNEKDELMFGKMIENIKILAVTDGSGQDVFKSQTDIGTPSFLNFGLSSQLHDVLKKAEYLNGTDIELIVIPHGGAVPEENLETNVTSSQLRDFITTKAAEVKQDDATVAADSNANSNANATTPAS